MTTTVRVNNQGPDDISVKSQYKDDEGNWLDTNFSSVRVKVGEELKDYVHSHQRLIVEEVQES